MTDLKQRLKEIIRETMNDCDLKQFPLHKGVAYTEFQAKSEYFRGIIVGRLEVLEKVSAAIVQAEKEK